MDTEIVYDHAAGDFVIVVGGQVVGRAANYLAADEMLSDRESSGLSSDQIASHGYSSVSACIAKP